MPMKGASRRLRSDPRTALDAFTYRELIAQRAIAERASRRRGSTDAKAVLERIEAELTARRDAKFALQPAPRI